jgi:hypothetical protein
VRLGREFVEEAIYAIKHAIVPMLQSYIQDEVRKAIAAEEERINAHILAEVMRMRLGETLREPTK